MVKFLILLLAHLVALVLAPFYAVQTACAVSAGAYRHCRDNGGLTGLGGWLRFIPVAVAAVCWYSAQAFILVLYEGPTDIYEGWRETTADTDD